MQLLELCEPLFQYICRLNRSARKGGRFEPGQVRAEIKSLLGDMHDRSSSTPGLTAQLERVELPLLFFVDYMIKESELDFVQQWEELAHERNELAGDEKFFDMLDETLAESGEAAAERLTIFYTCIGLGFAGWYTGQPEYLRKKMMEISGRIRSRIDLDEKARICPEAYEHVDTSDLVLPARTGVIGIGLVTIGMIVVLIVANVILFNTSLSELRNTLDAITEYGETLVSPGDVTDG